MCAGVLDSAKEVMRLIPPNTNFTAGELLRLSRTQNGVVFTSAGSCRRLKTLKGDRLMSPFRITSFIGYIKIDGSMEPVKCIFWRYILRTRGHKWLLDGYVVPIWNKGDHAQPPHAMNGCVG